MIPWTPAEKISAPFSALDHADPSSRQRVAEEIEHRRIHVDLFVNNPGFRLSVEFHSHDPRQEHAEVEG